MRRSEVMEAALGQSSMLVANVRFAPSAAIPASSVFGRFETCRPGETMSVPQERRRIATLAIAARLPSMFGHREHVEAGGLMSYGVDLRANYRHAADFVGKILKGAKPGELPVELPTKFDLVVNLKTAKGIGLTIPESFLVRADEVIE
jgi:hypothetical protein